MRSENEAIEEDMQERCFICRSNFMLILHHQSVYKIVGGAEADVD
jgi:hypothetical protein